MALNEGRSMKVSWILGLGLLVGGCGSSEGADQAGGTTQLAASCNLNSGWPGDEYCIPPPPEEQGFQLHYGPSRYDDAAEVAKYLIEPGIDIEIDVPYTSGNKDDVFFYKRQYRMRRGSHHLIVSTFGAGSSVGTERRLGGSQNVVKDNPTGEIPPENVGIGMSLAASSALNLNLHHFNGTSEPLLREAWVNFWYVDPGTVTQEAKEIFLWADGPGLPPGGTVTVRGTRTINAEGRVLTLYGHRHSNNVRFSAYRTRGGNRELLLEDYDWLEPSVFEYNSLTQNAAPDPVAKVAGAYSGILDLQAGDVLEWECDIENKRTESITFGQNEAATSEMCILVGDGVGPALDGLSDF